jgi:nitric oxide reductase subunit C
MNIHPKYIFLTLCVAFLLYSATIYLVPGQAINSKAAEAAAGGRLVWQKYNCQSCHQLYGLGGYLGPDLTNVYSAKGKGETFIKALVRSGTKQMPAFDLTPEEEAGLVEFLRSTDASGVADPRKYSVMSNGMIEQQ